MGRAASSYNYLYIMCMGYKFTKNLNNKKSIL